MCANMELEASKLNSENGSVSASSDSDESAASESSYESSNSASSKSSSDSSAERLNFQQRYQFSLPACLRNRTITDDLQLQQCLCGGEPILSEEPEAANNAFFKTILQNLLTSTTAVPNAYLLGFLMNKGVFRSTVFNTLKEVVGRVPYNDFLYKHFPQQYMPPLPTSAQGSQPSSSSRSHPPSSATARVRQPLTQIVREVVDEAER